MCEQCVWCKLKMHVYSILNSVGVCVNLTASVWTVCVVGGEKPWKNRSLKKY